MTGKSASRSCIGAEPDSAKLRAMNPGLLGSGKGVNLPDSKIEIPTIGAKDRADIKSAVELGADFIALSFVRSPDDISSPANW